MNKSGLIKWPERHLTKHYSCVSVLCLYENLYVVFYNNYNVK